MHGNNLVGGQARRTAAYQLRVQLAANQFSKGVPQQVNNGDEELYNQTFIGLPIANLFVRADWPGWIAALRQPAAQQAVGISIASSATAVLIMMILGIPLGYFLARVPLPFKPFWVSLVFLPMVVPDLAGGILLLQTFGPYGWIGQPLDAHNIELTNNLIGIVLAQLFVAAPFVVVSSMAGFAGVDRELEQAAATLGDSRWQIFWNISLPLARPGIAAGITLAWIRAKIRCLDPDRDLEDPHGTSAAAFQQFAGQLRKSIGIRLAELGFAEEG